jgi:hypothetical protein
MELIGFKQYIAEVAPLIGALGRLAGGAASRGAGKAVASGAATGVAKGAAETATNQQNQEQAPDPNATEMMVDRATNMSSQNAGGIQIRSAANNTPAVQSKTGSNAVGPDSVHNTNSSVMAGQALQMGQLYGANNVGTKYRR